MRPNRNRRGPEVPGSARRARRCRRYRDLVGRRNDRKALNLPVAPPQALVRIPVPNAMNQ